MTTEQGTAGASGDATDRPIDEYQTVQEWNFSFRNFWDDGDVPREWIDVLARFVDSCDMDPDSIIDEVLKPQPTGEGVLLRTRTRRKYVQLIDEFEVREGRAAANAVRSFMIHNGVAMTPSILR